MKKYQKFIDQKKDIKSLADEEQFMYEVCTVSVCALQLLCLKEQIMGVSSPEVTAQQMELAHIATYSMAPIGNCTLTCKLAVIQGLERSVVA